MGRTTDHSDDASPGARRAAWAVVIFLGCAFSYSIGWQTGWARGASGADTRLKEFNDFLRDTRAANAPADAPASAADDSNDTA